LRQPCLYVGATVADSTLPNTDRGRSLVRGSEPLHGAQGDGKQFGRL